MLARVGAPASYEQMRLWLPGAQWRQGSVWVGVFSALAREAPSRRYPTRCLHHYTAGSPLARTCSYLKLALTHLTKQNYGGLRTRRIWARSCSPPGIPLDPSLGFGQLFLADQPPSRFDIPYPQYCVRSIRTSARHVYTYLIITSVSGAEPASACPGLSLFVPGGLPSMDTYLHTYIPSAGTPPRAARISSHLSFPT